ILDLGWRCVGDVERKAADQDLVEEIFIVAAGRRTTVDLAPPRPVEPPPPANMLRPPRRIFGEYVDAGAHVLAALVVVRRSREHRKRVVPQPLLVHVMERCRRDAEALRLAADIVQRDEAMVTVKRRILERLGHHRTGELLELHRDPDDLTPTASSTKLLAKVGGDGGVEEVEDGEVLQIGVLAGLCES